MLLIFLISRCAIEILVRFEERENVCQCEDGFLRTEPLAQGALDVLGGSHSGFVGRVYARDRA